MITELDIRKLSDRGIEAFRSYLDDQCSDNATPPYGLLTDAKTSIPIAGEGRVVRRPFASRLDAARYLDEALAAVGEEDIVTDIGLWSWLSLFYFNQVSPVDKLGRRKPGRDYRHILEPGYPNGHRHLLAGAYLVYVVYGWGDDIAPFLLSTPPHIESKFNHEFASRQSFITNRGIMEAACKLYFDPQAHKIKHGAQATRSVPGTLGRFIDVIQQLELNYDLYSMTGSEVISLLPDEFEKWKI